MTPQRRKLLGNIFLVLTLLCLITALGNGGWWWAGVMVFAGATLWGIGGTNDEGKLL